MSQTVFTHNPFPKVGIRPIIDGRRRGVRESLEDQTMKMAEAAAKLAKAEADRKVVEARTTAEAEVMKREVAVYADERDYLRARLYEKTAPRVTDVVTADDPREMMGIPAKSTFATEKGGAK